MNIYMHIRVNFLPICQLKLSSCFKVVKHENCILPHFCLIKQILGCISLIRLQRIRDRGSMVSIWLVSSRIRAFQFCFPQYIVMFQVPCWLICFGYYIDATFCREHSLRRPHPCHDFIHFGGHSDLLGFLKVL